MNVENKLAKVLDKQEDFLVVKAAERDKVLSEISARMARYEKFDPEMYAQLKALRTDVKDIFNKGLAPGDEIMEQLYFLDPQTRDLVEKLGRSYTNIVTPDDFQQIALIMSEHLRSQVPILKDFTKFFGRLAEDYMLNAIPAKSDLGVDSVIKRAIFDDYRNGRKLPKWLSRILAIRDESLREKILRRIPGYDPDGILATAIGGTQPPKDRATGYKVGGLSIASVDIVKGVEVLYPNKLPKKWTNIPWVNFDGKTLEQNFTQTFEEKLMYKDAEGKWITNILQIPQKTTPSAWEEWLGKSNKINDIADAGKARTAFAVNGE
jgi:hypothetical protein